MHVLHLMYEPSPSGISVHVEDVVRLLPEQQHTVVLPRVLIGPARRLEALGAAVQPVAMNSRILPRAALLKIPRIVRRSRPDLVHLHALEAGLFGTLAARLGGGPPVVFQPQTIEIRKRFLLPALRTLLGVAGRDHAAWIAVSSLQAERMRAFAPRGRVHTVFNAPPQIEPLPERAAARAKLGWPADRLVVVSVGRLAAQKDPLTFVRAALGAPDVLHVLVGDGPLRKEVERAAEGVANVLLQGYVDDPRAVYAGADVLCLHSLWEGMSFTLLEALSCGLPVVASRIPGNCDLVLPEKTGLLFEPGDAAGLRTALARLAGDPALRGRLGAAAREHIRTSFTEERMAEGLRAVYAQVLATDCGAGLSGQPG